MLRLDGRVALVTGARGGLGAAIVRALAEAGAQVVAADLAQAPAPDQLTGAALALALDVTDEDGWTAAIDAVDARFGRLDILVNNAGILRRAPIETCSRDEFDRVVAVNQTGTFLGMKAAVRLMRRTGPADGGSIVNVSSTAGLRGARGHVAYVASKFAVRGMTKVAAIEFAALGIRVNSLHPGLVRSAMSDVYFTDRPEQAILAGQLIDRVADPAEVAAMVVFLASDAAGYATGAEFVCDGGITLGPR